MKKLKKIVEFLEKDRFGIFGIFWLVIIIGIIRAYLEYFCYTGEVGIWSLNDNDIMTSLAALKKLILLFYFHLCTLFTTIYLSVLLLSMCRLY